MYQAPQFGFTANIMLMTNKRVGKGVNVGGGTDQNVSLGRVCALSTWRSSLRK